MILFKLNRNLNNKNYLLEKIKRKNLYIILRKKIIKKNNSFYKMNNSFYKMNNSYKIKNNKLS
jgi:hypothetical protein